MIIRRAETKDIPFVINGIIEAERSGTEQHFYQLTFGLNDEETRKLIASVFEEEIEGQEWCLSHFFIAEENGQNLACLCAWCEKPGMESSGILKAQALSYFLGDKMHAAAEKLKLTSAVQIERTAGAIQLECIYTAPVARGRGIACLLIGHAISEVKKEGESASLAEIQLMTENDAAMRSYTKCGFFKSKEKRAQGPEILNLLPGTTRVVLSSKI